MRSLFLRALLEGLLEKQFGNDTMVELFDRYSKKITRSSYFLNPETDKTIKLFALLKRKNQISDIFRPKKSSLTMKKRILCISNYLKSYIYIIILRISMFIYIYKRQKFYYNLIVYICVKLNPEILNPLFYFHESMNVPRSDGFHFSCFIYFKCFFFSRKTIPIKLNRTHIVISTNKQNYNFIPYFL